MIQMHEVGFIFPVTLYYFQFHDFYECEMVNLSTDWT